MKAWTTQNETELTKEEIDAAVAKSVRINVYEQDPRLRVIGLFTDYSTFLRTVKRDNRIPESTKVAVDNIFSLLKPPVLRERIQIDLKLELKSLKTDWRVFYKFVLTNAIACDAFVPIKEQPVPAKSASKPPNAKQPRTQVG